MFTDDLETGFRGMFSKAKPAEAIAEDHNNGQIQQDSEQKDVPKSPSLEIQDVRKRVIVIAREWPRDPNGPPMKATPPGKVAEIGDLQHAKDEIAWAEQEAEPEELFPCDMATLLGDEDNRPPGVQKFIDEQFETDGCRISSRRYLKYQNRLPLYLLPEKLIVHDPDDTLHAHTGSHRPAVDRSTPRTYKLHLTQETRDAITRE
ncbi:hypothetical protein EV421DRAFT_1926527 [Armillaria borealis]|uniref:Uncharacterized protein n=1 Tax=Armillaria borealis TaxID=47425 RepID=A0AA39MVE3_9AGAR|nr:hypothetical protein EV421DRAFT_1926527 [Armillaria borealis]